MCFVFLVMVHRDSSPVGDVFFGQQKWKFQLFLRVETEDPRNELRKEKQLTFQYVLR